MFFFQIQPGQSEILHDLPVAFLGEKLPNRLGNHRPHFEHGLQTLQGSPGHIFQGAEVAGQKHGRAFAHVADAQSKDELRQASLLAGFDLSQQVGG